MVFGVTGVGKTTLRLRLEKLLLEEFLPNLQNNLGQIAVAGLEAIPAERGDLLTPAMGIKCCQSLSISLSTFTITMSPLPGSISTALAYFSTWILFEMLWLVG